MNNNNSNKALKIVLIVLGSIFGAIALLIGGVILLGYLLIRGGSHALSEYVDNRNEEARAKTFTTYYDESEVVSASYFYHEDGEVIWTDIPENKVAELAEDLDSLHISRVGGMKDYYYGGRAGIKLVYENGNSILFDGERIHYYLSGNSEEKDSIYMYFEEDFEGFWDILNKYTEEGVELHSPFYQPEPGDVSGG